MVNKELYIDSIKVAMPSNFALPITFQINDVADITNRNADYSKSVKLPITSELMEAIENANEFNAITDKPYVTLDAKYVIDGIEVVSKGRAVIRQVTKNYVELNIYAGIYKFFKAIEDLSIQDIQAIKNLRHTRDSTNIIESSFGAHYGSKDYIYPVIDWGDFILVSDSSDMSANGEYLYPAVWVKWVIQKIISEAGYSLEEALDINKPFDGLILPVEAKVQYYRYGALEQNYSHPNGEEMDVFIYNMIRNAVYTPGGNIDIYHWDDCDVVKNGVRILRETVDGYVGGDYAFSQMSDVQVFKIFVTTKIDIICRANIYRQGGGPSASGDKVGFAVTVLNPLGGVHELYRYTQYVQVDGTEFNITVNGLIVDQNDIVRITMLGEIGTPADAFEISDFYFELYVNNEYNNDFGIDIDIAENLPDITQKDFIKQVANMFSLMFIQHPILNQIGIYPFSKITDNIYQKRDWSEKLDINKDILFTHRLDDYAKKNNMLYSEEDEDINLVDEEEYKSYISVDDDNLDDEKDLFTLDFAGSDDIILFEDTDTVQIKSANLTDGINPRILRIYPKPMGAGFSVLLGSTTYAPVGFANVPFATFDQDSLADNERLGFESLIKTNYKEVVRMLDRYRKVTAYFSLSPTDIHNFDFMIPVYVRKFSANFYVNKIIDYTGEGSTKVELVRLGSPEDSSFNPDDYELGGTFDKNTFDKDTFDM